MSSIFKRKSSSLDPVQRDKKNKQIQYLALIDKCSQIPNDDKLILRKQVLQFEEYLISLLEKYRKENTKDLKDLQIFLRKHIQKYKIQHPKYPKLMFNRASSPTFSLSKKKDSFTLSISTTSKISSQINKSNQKLTTTNKINSTAKKLSNSIQNSSIIYFGKQQQRNYEKILRKRKSQKLKLSKNRIQLTIQNQSQNQSDIYYYEQEKQIEKINNNVKENKGNLNSLCLNFNKGQNQSFQRTKQQQTQKQQNNEDEKIQPVHENQECEFQNNVNLLQTMRFRMKRDQQSQSSEVIINGLKSQTHKNNDDQIKGIHKNGVVYALQNFDNDDVNISKNFIQQNKIIENSKQNIQNKKENVNDIDTNFMNNKLSDQQINQKNTQIKRKLFQDKREKLLFKQQSFISNINKQNQQNNIHYNQQKSTKSNNTQRIPLLQVSKLQSNNLNVGNKVNIIKKRNNFYSFNQVTQIQNQSYYQNYQKSNSYSTKDQQHSLLQPQNVLKSNNKCKQISSSKISNNIKSLSTIENKQNDQQGYHENSHGKKNSLLSNRLVSERSYVQSASVRGHQQKSNRHHMIFSHRMQQIISGRDQIKQDLSNSNGIILSRRVDRQAQSVSKERRKSGNKLQFWARIQSTINDE